MDNSVAGLARVLAKDSGMIVTVSGQGSYITQNGHINIAVMPPTHEGKMLATGLVFHEVGHKNHSDLKSKPPGLLGTMVNIIEDVWTERETIKERPGTRFNLDEVTTHYADKGGMLPTTLNEAICGKLMVHGRGKLLGQTGINVIEPACDEMLDDAFGSSFIDELVKLADEIKTVDSSAKAIALANKVEQLVINQKEEEDGEGELTEDGGSGSGGSPVEAGNSGADPSEGDEDDQGGTGPEDLPAKGAGGKCSNTEIDEMLQQESSYGDLSEMITEEIDKMSKTLTQTVIDSTPQLPKLHRDTDFHCKMNEVKAISAASRMRATMMGMLQDVKRSPESFGSSGKKIKSSKLINIGLGDPRIFSKKVEVKMLNTAVVIAIDYSGSMSGCIWVSNPSAFAVHNALAGLRGVSACSIGFGLEDKDHNDSIAILVGFKEKPESSRFNLGASGGTPTDTAIWCARAMLMERPEPRKILLIITDGEPDSRPRTRSATKRTMEDGIEIAAIGIDTHCVKHLWANSKCIKDVSELPACMFEILENLLTARKGM
jgi:hypothetical protein